MLNMIFRMMQEQEAVEPLEGLTGDPEENLRELYPKLCDGAAAMLAEIQDDFAGMHRAVASLPNRHDCGPFEEFKTLYDPINTKINRLTFVMNVIHDIHDHFDH